MRNLYQEAILRTIALYDALDIALTPFEIWRCLVRPQKPPRSRSTQPPSLFDIFKTLAQLKERSALEEKWGMYVLPGRTSLCEERIRQKKIADQKWKLVRRGARRLAFMPFVRLVTSNGSLAKLSTSDDSDLDILIVVKHGRIWTARLLATLLLQFLGWRRHGKYVRNRICLNHYIADNALTIRDELITTPHMIAWMEPILEPPQIKKQKAKSKKQLFEEFIEANNWVGEHLWNWEETKMLWQQTLRQTQPSLLSEYVRRALEWLLSGRIGDRLEKFSRDLQLRYMERSRRRLTSEETRYIKISDSALEFHPGLGRFYGELKNRLAHNLDALGLSLLEYKARR